jgi:transcriptional regulator GlxA family with amidase domain
VNALDATPDGSPALVAPARAGAPSADLSLRLRLDRLQDLEGAALREEWRPLCRSEPPRGSAAISCCARSPIASRNSLRAAARFGAVVGWIDTGTFALAQAGLLDQRSAVLHWEAVPAFKERFPRIQVQGQIYSIEGQRITCAGGIATLDMMLDLIGRLNTPALANEVANALVYAARPAATSQRLDDRPKPTKRALSDRVVALMERHLDFPLSLDEIARHLDVSHKTVLRECLRSFEETPMRLYLRIRLQASRNMLFYQEFGIKDVATACGFSYPSVFSRAFRAQFGMTPREFRLSFRRQQNQAYRPEVRRLSASDPTLAFDDETAKTAHELSAEANNESISVKSQR